LIFNNDLQKIYPDIYTTEALAYLSVLSHFNREIKDLLTNRMQRRTDRQINNERINFLDSSAFIPGTNINRQDARDGKFEGAVIPADLQRQ